MQDIVDELKSVKVDINIPTAEDMPKLEIGNLSDLKTILSEKPSGAVGAEKGASKIDQFIDVANDKFDRLEEKVVQFDDTIKIVNDTTKELNEIKVKSEDLENKLYSKLDSTVDRNADRSYVDRRLQEIASELKNEDLQIINSRLFNVESNMSKLQNVIDNQSDIMFSNINRLDLR
jgi:archaellum component FlaC